MVAAAYCCFFVYTIKRKRDCSVTGIATGIFCESAYSPYNTQVCLYTAWVFCLMCRIKFIYIYIYIYI